MTSKATDIARCAWQGRQLWSRILDALVARGVLALSASIDSSYVKVHRSAHGAKGAKAQADVPPLMGPFWLEFSTETRQQISGRSGGQFSELGGRPRDEGPFKRMSFQKQ